MLLQSSDFILGFAVSAIISGLAYRGRSLSKSGFLGALVIGTAVFGLGGWQSFLCLILFFFSSSLLTKYRFRNKVELGITELKAGARNIWQTIGQGGAGAILLLLASLYAQFWIPLILAFVSSLGEANADTWAVEIGVLSKKKPRLITDLKREVPPGTQGGVTVLGEAAALLGATFIATIAAILGTANQMIIPVILVCTISAFLGEHIDSMLGATVQAIYFCPKCQKETEKKVHKCGTIGQLQRGIPIISNEAVNFLSTAFAAFVSLILFVLIL